MAAEMRVLLFPFGLTLDRDAYIFWCFLSESVTAHRDKVPQEVKAALGDGSRDDKLRGIVSELEQIELQDIGIGRLN